MLIKFLFGIFLAILGYALYVRLAPIDVAFYAQSPELAPSTGKPNEYRLVGADAPLFDVDADTLFEAANAVILAEARVKPLARDKEALQASYVQRSLVMGFPDVISIEAKIVDDDHSRLEIYSRSIYGRSDFSVNEDRVEDWLKKISQSIEN